MPVKSLSDAFSVDDAIWNPFWTHFWRQEGALRHEKSLKSFVLSSRIKVSPFSARVASGARLGTLLGSILGAFWPPDGSNMASRGPKTAPRRPWEPPRRLLYASRTAPAPPKTPPRPPKTPPRLSKSLQDGSVSLQELSKSSPGEVFEAPSRLQELCGGGFQASSCCLATSSLWPASGLGGMREALTINMVYK